MESTEDKDKQLAVLVDFLDTIEKGLETKEDIIPHQPALVTTHMAIQQKQNEDQKTTIRQQWVALFVSVLVLIPGWVTSAYQLFHPTNSTG